MLKATFEVSMISRDGTVNLSNMPVTDEGPVSSPSVDTDFFFRGQDSTGWKYTKFETTPKVSDS